MDSSSVLTKLSSLGASSLEWQKSNLILRGTGKNYIKEIMRGNRTHFWEVNGRSNDIDDSTMDNIKGPNVLERAKDEIEAIVHTMHSRISSDQEQLASEDGNEVKPSRIARVKGWIEEHVHKEVTLLKETHGRRNDIDEYTPIDKVKGPNVFERAKEEIEALVGTVHPKNDPGNKQQKEKEGFWEFLAKRLERCCHPFGGKRD